MDLAGIARILNDGTRYFHLDDHGKNIMDDRSVYLGDLVN